MTARKSRSRGPIVLPPTPGKRRRRRGIGDALGVEALEVPLPGPLLVLLSRLHRSESKARPGKPGESIV